MESEFTATDLRGSVRIGPTGKEASEQILIGVQSSEDLCRRQKARKT